MEVTATMLEDCLALVALNRSSTGESAYMKDLNDNAQRWGCTDPVQLVMIGTLMSSDGKVLRNNNNIPCQAYIIAVNGEGVEGVANVEAQCKAIATEYMKCTKPYKGAKNPKPIKAAFKFVTNPGEPKKASEVITNRDTIRLLASVYYQELADGSFWDRSEELFDAYFNDSDISELTKALKYEHEQMAKESDE